MIDNLTVENIENIIGVKPVCVSKNNTELSFIKNVTLFGTDRYYVNVCIINTKTLIVYGSISIFIDKNNTNYAYIYSLFVNRNARKQGYGTKLITEVEKIIKKLGFTTSYLQVSKDSWIIEWYKHLGYINDFSFFNDKCYQLYKDFK